MCRFKFFPRYSVAAVILLFALALFSACGHGQRSSSEAAYAEDAAWANSSDGSSEILPSEALLDGEPLEGVPVTVLEIATGTYPWRIPVSDLPVVVNDRVLAWINYFTDPKRGRPIYAKWLERKSAIEAMIYRQLKEQGVPQDLIYLSMIESGFNAKAYSRARASGLWQFMSATGGRYGLKSNHWVDERRDPDKATGAAARHLRDLYEIFDDWYLAAAAYNAGSGKVNRAIARHKTRDFWELANARRPYLRAETRNYVPKLLAALIIGKQPEVFGFKTYPIQSEVGYDYAELEDATSLYVIARSTHLSADQIRQLNPELRYAFTPPVRKAKSYRLRLPLGQAEPLKLALAKIPKKDRVTFRRHRVSRGQTLGSIARRYRTNVGAIMSLNNIRNARRVRAGRVLFIPVPHNKRNRLANVSAPSKRGRIRAASKKQKSSQAINRQWVKHRVRRGDTLWDLSQKYAVSVPALRRWNNLNRSSKIFPGDVLRVHVEDA